MHFCPDCEEECNCGCDYEEDSDNCEHVCETEEEKAYREDYESGFFDEDYNPWDEEEEFIYDED